MLKIAVFAPMPSASVVTTMIENDGRLKSDRRAKRQLTSDGVHDRSPVKPGVGRALTTR